MTWVRIDDGAPLHPKLLDAGAEAAWLWVAGLAHANRCHTDGAILRRHLPALYPGQWSPADLERLALRLVEVGLWESDGADFRIHDYDHYQQEATREAVEARRAYERARKADQRTRKRGTSPGPVPDNVPDKSRDMSHGTTAGHLPGTPVGHAQGTQAPPVPAPRPVPSRPKEEREAPLAVFGPEETAATLSRASQGRISQVCTPADAVALASLLAALGVEGQTEVQALGWAVAGDGLASLASWADVARSGRPVTVAALLGRDRQGRLLGEVVAAWRGRQEREAVGAARQAPRIQAPSREQIEATRRAFEERAKRRAPSAALTPEEASNG